jgi:hypothetical protein
LPVPAIGRHIEAGDLVVEAAIPTVAREVADQRVRHLDAGGAAAGAQALHVGHHVQFHLAEEPTVLLLPFGCRHVLELAAVRPRRVVLHVDEEERGVRRLDRNVPGGEMGHGPSLE